MRKALGQHHLRDGALCRPLVEFLRPRGERVLEIGPGGGVLTAELARAGAHVLALELDRAWAIRLRRLAVGGAPIAIAVGDALDLDWQRLAPGTLVTGNLPYNVATALIERCLVAAAGVPRAAFLVQLEVAERLTAAPGDEAYGSLSVLVAAYARPTWLGRVRRGSFVPPPKVDGGFVGLERRVPPLPPAAMPALLE
ncbi:MAG: ribosomal RNA small subunit methyltransferase A, partial [Acidobacteriota bacterium]